jgi:YaiO family outer membrane protein
VKNAFLRFLFLGMLILLFQANSFAQDEETKRHRLEAYYSYEHLTPHDVYGSWKTLNLTYYDHLKRDLTYLVSFAAFSRNEGDAVLGNIGMYKDWGTRLYTFTSLSTGTNSEYLPQIRIDHDFNIKMGSSKNIVWTLGLSYIDYYNIHKDTILSTGITLYLKDWILNYRVFRNDSDPGDVISYSQLVSAGYGREGWQWTYLNLSYGKQAYYAAQLVNPQEVSQTSLYVDLKHRRWIGKGYGIFIDISYFKLKDGYEKYGFAPGIFKEF